MLEKKLEEAIRDAGPMVNAMVPLKFKLVLLEICQEIDKIRAEREGKNGG